MKIKSKYESPLVLNKFEIIEGVFRKNIESLDDLELEVKVNHSLKQYDEEIFEVLLNTTVCDKNEKLFVSATGRGIFITEQKNMGILEKNTIAIMFPYLRSYISLLTSHPGMNPIVLPAININAMINDKNK